MSFGISDSVMSRAVQVCTPELFHKAIQSKVVKDVCAQIEDALESRRRGEMSKEDFETLKSQLKKRLPILTPHATFKDGRRTNKSAIPSGLSIYDKDHITNPRGWWEEKKKSLDKAVLDLIVLIHVTPSGEGLRLVFVIPDGMSLAEAQKWMSEKLEDEEYDVCVKDLARPSFIVPQDYILFINEEELFKDRKPAGEGAGGKTEADGAAAGEASGGKTEAGEASSGEAAGGNGNHKVQSSNLKVQSKNVQDNRLSGTDSHRAVSSGSAVQPAQPANSNGADAGHLSAAGVPQNADGVESAQIFPNEYQGIPYSSLVAKLIECWAVNRSMAPETHLSLHWRAICATSVTIMQPGSSR
mgnify:CR=1 FL=1